MVYVGGRSRRPNSHYRERELCLSSSIFLSAGRLSIDRARFVKLSNICALSLRPSGIFIFS